MLGKPLTSQRNRRKILRKNRRKSLSRHHRVKWFPTSLWPTTFLFWTTNRTQWMDASQKSKRPRLPRRSSFANRRKHFSSRTTQLGVSLDSEKPSTMSCTPQMHSYGLISQTVTLKILSLSCLISQHWKPSTSMATTSQTLNKSVNWTNSMTCRVWRYMAVLSSKSRTTGCMCWACCMSTMKTLEDSIKYLSPIVNMTKFSPLKCAYQRIIMPTWKNSNQHLQLRSHHQSS